MRRFFLAFSVSIVILLAGALVPESGSVRPLDLPASQDAESWNSVA